MRISLTVGFSTFVRRPLFAFWNAKMGIPGESGANLSVGQRKDFLERPTRCECGRLSISRLAKCRSLITTIRASALLTLVAGFLCPAYSQSPIIFDYPGATGNPAYGFVGTSLYGINNNGEIVGAYYDSENNEHGFSYEGGGFSPPINAGGAWTNAVGVSDRGVIVGSTYTNPRYTYDAIGYVDNGGTITGFGYPNTEIGGISSNGTYIVGYNFIASTITYQAFLYSGGAATTLQDPSFTSIRALGVNNRAQVVGQVSNSGTGSASHGFLYKDGAFTLLDYPGASSTTAEGINDSGVIVGSYSNTTGYHAFLYNAGRFTSFDIPGASWTVATGINNIGEVVGYCLDAQNRFHGLLYPTGPQGYVNPKYLIMGVTYAPPGGSASSVSYMNQNVVGNTSTITNSFTNSVNVSVSISGGGEFPGVVKGKVTETLSGGWTQKTTTSNSVTVNKTNSTTFKTPGVPNVYSPVNHDYDIIWIWLNPASIFTVPNSNTGGPIVWNGYGYDLNDPLQDIDVWPIYVGYLNGDFGPLSSQDANALSRTWVTTQTFGPGQGPGITSSDFPNILKADPFAYNPYDANSGYILTLAPGTTPAASTDGRFTASSPNNATPESIPYAQAPLNSTQGIQDTYQSIYSTTTTATNTSDVSYTVGFGYDENLESGFLNVMGVGEELKLNWNLTWENISQTSNTNTNTQTDTAVITGPPCPAATAPCNPEYTEPHEFAVYQDNLYGTFMLWPNPYFSITGVAPTKGTVAIGSAANYTILTQANAGYSGTSISFNVAGLPAGASFNSGAAELGNPFSLVVTTASTTPSGTFPLTITASDGALSYIAYATLVVLPPTTTSLVSSLNPSNFGQAVSFTATVMATGSKTPTGTVTFNDGSLVLGTSVLDSSGMATYTASSLAVGQHSITAVYGGDANNAGSTSAVLNESVNTGDFSLSSTPSSATVSAGTPAPFTVTITPQGSFSNSITLSCSGLPMLAGCTFSPSTVTPNANTTTSKLSVSTVAEAASLGPPAFGHRSSPLYTICLALPALLLGAVRLATPKSRRLLNYALMCLLAGVCLSQVACGRGSSGGSGSTGRTPIGTYTITVTGAAGSTQHTTTVTLTVQ